MTDLLSPCRAVFAQDPVRYLDLTETVRRGDGRVLYAGPTGALVAFNIWQKNGQDTGFTMFAQDLDTAERLCDLMPSSPSILTVHEDFYRSLLERRFGLRLGQTCWQAAYLGRDRMPLPSTDLMVRQLDVGHLVCVSAHYKLGGEHYLSWLLERGALYGAFQQDELCGFIGTHAEGSVGLLEVLPQYRRRGIATLLQRFMTNLELDRGHIPYCQIFDGNEPSLALQRSLGCAVSHGPLYWAIQDE
jgi:tRNA (guanine37-N1)-methyltransferase